MNMMLVLAIYVVAIVSYVAFSRRRQAKAQEDRFAGLAKGAEVETIGGLIAIVDEIDKENNRIVLDAEGVFLTFDLSRSIMKVITPAPTTETTKKTIIEEDSAIESADEK
ncbi:preprotein translocase subunit YajC [Streptococcus salivarius]